MSVDLSKAVKGATVKFRCGAELEIAHTSIEYKGATAAYCHSFSFKGYDGWSEPYQACGSVQGTSVRHPFDIISLTPPAFDWATVKAGDRFLDHNEQEVVFVGWSIYREGNIGNPDLKLAVVEKTGGYDGLNMVTAIARDYLKPTVQS